MVSSLPIATRLDAATRHDRHALGVARNGDLADRLEKLPRAIPALPKRLNELPRKLLEPGKGVRSRFWLLDSDRSSPWAERSVSSNAEGTESDREGAAPAKPVAT